MTLMTLLWRIAFGRGHVIESTTSTSSQVHKISIIWTKNEQKCQIIFLSKDISFCGIQCILIILLTNVLSNNFRTLYPITRNAGNIRIILHFWTTVQWSCCVWLLISMVLSATPTKSNRQCHAQKFKKGSGNFNSQIEL